VAQLVLRDLAPFAVSLTEGVALAPFCLLFLVLLDLLFLVLLDMWFVWVALPLATFCFLSSFGRRVRGPSTLLRMLLAPKANFAR
jgi:hypothetical protein